MRQNSDLLTVLARRAHPVLVLLAATLALLWANHWRLELREMRVLRRSELSWLAARSQAAQAEHSESEALRALKRRDIEAFKQGLATLTLSKRAIYEAGLALQEEKRLLEKQWDVLIAYLMVDEQEGRVLVMRGDQPLESFMLPGPGRLLGIGTRPPPALAQIVSKERFAHPERGAYVEQDGQLQWNPPQVGESLRANALGEFVMFTRGSLILHGPPKKAEEHAQFPHYCLELSLGAARKLYGSSFVGTKVLFKAPAPPKPAFIR